MFTPQIQTTPDLKTSQIHLYTLFTIGLFLALSKLLGAPSIALNEILQSSLLLCGALCLNYCLVVFFVILSLFNTLMISQIIGIQIQQYFILGANKLSGNNGKDIFLYTIFVVTIFFNFVAVIVSFFAYKKFKKAVFNGGNGLTAHLDKGEGNGGKKDFEAFKGEGVKIGD